VLTGVGLADVIGDGVITGCIANCAGVGEAIGPVVGIAGDVGIAGEVGIVGVVGIAGELGIAVAPAMGEVSGAG
jgi:hypothetical protein